MQESTMRRVMLATGLALTMACGGASPAAHRISGTVSGLAGTSIAVSLSGPRTATTTTDSNGGYSFSGLASGDYTVAPADVARTFSPASLAVTVGWADVPGQDFKARGMLSVSVSGSGLVTSVPAGINCGSTCAAVYDAGTTVTLSATAATRSVFSGWSGAGCSGTGTCTLTLATATAVTAFFDRWNAVFVTSTTYQPGALGGLAGADDACQARAAAAGLPGTYRAWLSTSGAGAVDAIARLGSARGWVRPDGKPFVDTTTDLAGGRIMYPPRLDESGNDLGQVFALTATTADGTLHPLTTTCSDYTDTNASGIFVGGWASAGSGMFTVFDFRSCSAWGHLYCFGVDQSRALGPTPVAGRRAFVTNAFFTTGGGLGAADALCASEASAASLPGTFLAALATTTASASSRFDTTGAPWVRADGLALTPTAAALFSTPYMDVAFNVNADGTAWFGNYGVWGGASSWSSVGTAASTCDDYTSTVGSSAVGGRVGDTKATTLFGFDTMDPCNATWMKLLCMQN